MIKILELKKSTSDKNIVYFPYAGSFAKASMNLINFIPKEYGFLVIEYPDNFSFVDNDFNKFAWHLGQIIREYLTSDTILMGTSFGGYLAYKISQLYHMANQYSADKLILISVQDIIQLKNLISSPNLDISSLFLLNNLSNHEITNEIYRRLQKDIDCLKSIEINNKIKILSDTYIFNGKEDPTCHHEKTIPYWKERTLGKFRSINFEGSHIPTLLSWEQIFEFYLKSSCLNMENFDSKN